MRASEIAISSLSLLWLYLIFPAASGDNSAYLFHICSSSGQYAAGSPYASNLKQLLDGLVSNAPITPFNVNTFGQNTRNEVNGGFLCRGDVSSPDCKNCVATAGEEIQKKCPNRKGAIIWYDFCFLKYSNTRFFGRIDYGNTFYMYNVQEVNDRGAFNEQVKNLLTSLSEEVQMSSNLYAVEELEIGPSKVLYGLVQCTRDLSGADCKKCLDDAIGALSSCCNGKIGGRVVGGSCNFRYELYPIVDAQT